MVEGTSYASGSPGQYGAMSIPKASADPAESAIRNQQPELTSNGYMNNPIFTHGYVHGHIHKHKDHTHIHGHIHNHDHDHHAHQNTGGSNDGNLSLENAQECKRLEELAYCKDIFCDELDDCFFLSCDDSHKSTADDKCELSCDNSYEGADATCCDDARCVEIHPKHGDHEDDHDHDVTCCEDENCPELKSGNSHSDSDCSVYDEECSTECCDVAQQTREAHRLNKHQDFCEPQLSKRPIFENLITNVHQNLNLLPELNAASDQLANTADTEQESGDQKRQKLDNRKDFEIHFPHACHQQISTTYNVSPQPNNLSDNLDHEAMIRDQGGHKHIRQSCFHTTIPNANTGSFNVDDLMLDYDFYVQFNTFNQYLNNNIGTIQQEHPNSVGSEAGASIEGLKSEMHSASDSLLSTPLRPQLDSMNKFSPSDERSIHGSVYSCQWDACSRKVTDDTFMKHLIDQHIRQSYEEHSLPTSINPKATTYSCEWSDCNYIDNNLDSLIDHLSVHKEHHSTQVALNNNQLSSNQYIPTLNSQNQFLLTPSSQMSSPRLNEIPSSTSSSAENVIFPTVSPLKDETKLNITALKIMPKKKNTSASCLSESSGPFVCKWDVGTDANGNPISCDQVHETNGGLQEHLIKDHIGSGKPVYHCKWIGCERHNGKLFNQRQKLFRHIHIHTNYKPCKCEICGACFAVESILKQHMRTHSGEKPFTCSTCGKQFATSSSLSIHNRVHSGERPLQCKWPGCNKRFRESSNLTKHMRTHYRTFQCEVCGEEFDKKTNYTKHMKLHKDNLVIKPLPVAGELGVKVENR